MDGRAELLRQPVVVVGTRYTEQQSANGACEGETYGSDGEDASWFLYPLAGIYLFVLRCKVWGTNVALSHFSSWCINCCDVLFDFWALSHFGTSRRNNQLIVYIILIVSNEHVFLFIGIEIVIIL